MLRRIGGWFRRKNRYEDYYAGRGGSDTGSGTSMAAEEARFRSQGLGGSGTAGPPGGWGSSGGFG